MTDPACPDEGFATAQVQGGYVPGVAQNTAVPPIYQTTAFEFASLADARDLFALRTSGNLYSRNANPTQLVLEQRVAQLEGGASAAAVASGQAAVAVALLALAKQGEHLVAARQLYGGSVDLLQDTFADWGIDVTFVDQDDLDAWRGAIRPTTRALFAESITNPLAQVLDMRAVADIAHDAGVPLVIDNTVATPALLRPKEHGADIVVHSLTKFLGGHGNSMGGAIVDGGTFDWSKSGNYPMLSEPRPEYAGMVLHETFGNFAFAIACRVLGLRDFGPSISPFNAFLILQGIETLSLRMQRHCDNALKVAEWLSGQPQVAWVSYPGLPGDANHALQQRYAPKGAGAVFTFGLKGGFDAGVKVVESVELFSHLANIGDVRSLIIHPASTTHRQLSDEQKSAAGAGSDVIRLSVGIEDPDDIIADLAQALAKAG